MKHILYTLLLCSAVAFAQGVRLGDSSPVTSVVTINGNNYVVTVPGTVTTVSMCNKPANGVPCTNRATTYTDSTITIACSTSTQITLAGTSACVARPDAYGNWGMWVAPGQYEYTITTLKGNYGPFALTASPTTGSDATLANLTVTGAATFANGIIADSVFPASGTLLLDGDVSFGNHNLSNLSTLFLNTGETIYTTQFNTSPISGNRIYGSWVFGTASELITLSTSGTTTDSVADLLPANSIIESVAAYVYTAITTATDWKVGDNVVAGRFIATNGNLTKGYSIAGTVQIDQSGTSGPRQTSAAKVRITTTGTPGAGKILVVVFYRTVNAPTLQLPH
jgi:hypothetical protein